MVFSNYIAFVEKFNTTEEVKYQPVLKNYIKQWDIKLAQGLLKKG